MKTDPTFNNRDSTMPFMRRVIISFLILLSMICACFTVLYAMYDIGSLMYLQFITMVLHIIWLIVFLSYKDMPVDPLLKMYLSYVLMALYPIACIYWNAGNPVVFSWFSLIIIGAIVFHMHNITLWIFLTLAIAFSIFFFSSLFPQEQFTSQLINRANILTVLSTLILAAFFAIVYVHKIKIDESVYAEALQVTAKNTENMERDNALYSNIINYLEENKPFKDPNFDAHALAKALQTNVKYISKAISAGNSGDFHTLLNSFRINYVKSMFDGGALKKYTIDYIYAEAGYKHRSTFNAAFKSITGMTPSSYVSRQNTNDNSQL